MDELNTSMAQEQENCELLATLAAAIGVRSSLLGSELLKQGYDNDDPELKKQGLRMLMAGAGLSTTIAPLVAAGFMTESQLMKYLAARGASLTLPLPPDAGGATEGE